MNIALLSCSSIFAILAISMDTITIPKEQYEMLKQQAALYEKIFKRSKEMDLDVEMYTPERIKEFEQADELDSETRERVEKFLRTLETAQ